MQTHVRTHKAHSDTPATPIASPPGAGCAVRASAIWASWRASHRDSCSAASRRVACSRAAAARCASSYPSCIGRTHMAEVRTRSTYSLAPCSAPPHPHLSWGVSVAGAHTCASLSFLLRFSPPPPRPASTSFRVRERVQERPAVPSCILCTPAHLPWPPQPVLGTAQHLPVPHEAKASAQPHAQHSSSGSQGAARGAPAAGVCGQQTASSSTTVCTPVSRRAAALMPLHGRLCPGPLRARSSTAST